MSHAKPPHTLETMVFKQEDKKKKIAEHFKKISQTSSRPLKFQQLAVKGLAM